MDPKETIRNLLKQQAEQAAKDIRTDKICSEHYFMAAVDLLSIILEELDSNGYELSSTVTSAYKRRPTIISDFIRGLRR